MTRPSSQRLVLESELTTAGSAALTALDSRYTFRAPAPSGGDDTATLQPLLTAAQNTNGTLVLGYGTYKANLATAQSFNQPRIVGQGFKYTTIQGYVNTSPVLRFKGGSGAMCGGIVQDLSITGTGGVGMELADVCGFRWTRLRITGTLAEGITFHNESTNAFSEYNMGDVDIESGVVLPIRYKKTGGNESFHGSGLTVGSIINQAAGNTSPMIQIDSGCFPYASPMTVALFPRNTGGSMIVNNSTRVPSFFGQIDVEAQAAGPMYLADPNLVRVFHEGNVTGLASSNLKLGNLFLVDSVYYVGGSTFARIRPYKRMTTLAAGSSDIVLEQFGSCMVEVNLIASNYHYTYLLHCWQSPYDPTGVVTILANPKALNTAGLGAPTFTWSNYRLQVVNSNYSSSVTAQVVVTPINQAAGTTDMMGQY